MARKKILWLCSWYPGKTSPFNGDFIQRHAQAAALYNDICVLHVTGDASGMIKKKSEEISRKDGLTEHIIYFKRSNSFFGRLSAYYRWLFLSKSAIKNYVRQHGKPDLVHVHIPVRMGILGMWMKRRWGTQYALTEHWGIYNDEEQLNFSKRSVNFKNYTRVIFRNATRFISVSRFLAEGVNRLVMKKDFTVIPNTVNTEYFFYEEKNRPRDPAGETVFRFIHVSNMVPIKNPEGILRAFRIYHQNGCKAELVMVGDTDPAIHKMAVELGIREFVKFKGELSYQQVAIEMQQANCLVLFSHMENSPCVIGEALCCGLPVIATEVGGIPELLDQSNSMLTKPRDEKTLADTMFNMEKDYDRFDREKIAREARDKFSYSVIGKKLDEVYSESTGND